MKESKSWLHHIEFFFLFIILIILCGKIIKQIDSQSERIDKLYEMFIPVQNEIKDLSVRAAVVEICIIRILCSPPVSDFSF